MRVKISYGCWDMAGRDGRRCERGTVNERKKFRIIKLQVMPE